MRIKYTMFMLAAILAACTNEPLPETIVEEAPESYTLVVTATKGNDDTTKALSLDGKTLNATWAEGETVSVYSVTGEGISEAESTNPVGTLTAQGSGATTTLKGEFVSTYTPTVGTKLRLKFNDKPDYTTQEGSLDYIAAHCDYAVADITISTVDAVTGDVTSTTPASFANQQAIVKFSLKQPDGTTPVAATSLTVKVGSTTYNVTPAAAASDIFVAVRKASNKAVSLSANTATGNFSYDKTGITFENGKYYAIGVKMTRIPTLGDLYYSDGTFSWTLEDGKTPIGVIAYVGTDAFSENGVTLRDGSTTLQSHGLVLALKNVSDGIIWRPSSSSNQGHLDFESDAKVGDTDALKRNTLVSGYSYTKRLAEKTNAATDYPAAYQAWNYTGLPAPATSTGWFMPSAQQWVRMLMGLGGLEESVISWQTQFDSGTTAIGKWDTAMAKAGAEGTAYDKMVISNTGYWSVSEFNANASVHLVVFASSPLALLFSWDVKFEDDRRLRPILAF